MIPFIYSFRVGGKQGLGLAIDWLELLDPEISSLCSDIQDRLLFGASTVSPTKTGTTETVGAAYLRSQMAHQAHWTTLNQTVTRLLSADDPSTWSSTAVLDFLSLCMNHPRLYQGRERKQSSVG